MNQRHSNFSTLITATVFAVVLSLLHVPIVFAGLASDAPGVVSVGAGVVSRDAETTQMDRASYALQMAKIRSEYQLERARIYLFETSVVATHIFAAVTNPPAFIVLWSLSTALRASGAVPKEKSVLLRMSVPLIPFYDAIYANFAAPKAE